MMRVQWRNEGIEISNGYHLVAGKVRKQKVQLPSEDGPLLVQEAMALLDENTRYDLEMKTPEQIEDVRHRGHRAGYGEGYREGYDDGVADLKDRELKQDESIIDPEERRFIEHEAKKEALVEHTHCHRCQAKDPTGLHHIIPRRVGGCDLLENLIPLCEGCHNDVEAATDELLDEKKLPSRSMLREYIETNFPNE